MLLGDNNGADDAKMMQQQMQGGGAAPAEDMTKIFNNEGELITLMEHRWELEGVEQRLLKKYSRK